MFPVRFYFADPINDVMISVQIISIPLQSIGDFAYDAKYRPILSSRSSVAVTERGAKGGGADYKSL